MRAFATAVHRWAGLAVALFLIVSGLTGAVISWDHEIDGWLNRKLYDTTARGPFKDPFELAAAVERHDPRARVAYLPLGFEEGHAAGYFVQPRTDPATGKPFRLGYNQVFVDPVTAEVRGQRDSAAVSLRPETLMPFLRKLHYMLHVPAMWGTDRIGWWIMGTVALVWLLDSFVALYLTMPRRLRRSAQAVHAVHRPPSAWWQRWKPAWTVRWAAGGYKLNFDLHRAGGLWIWLLIIVIAFTSFSLNLYKEVFYPVLSLVSKTTPGPYETQTPAPFGTYIPPTLDFMQAVDAAKAVHMVSLGAVEERAQHGLVAGRRGVPALGHRGGDLGGGQRAGELVGRHQNSHAPILADCLLSCRGRPQDPSDAARRRPGRRTHQR